MNIDAGAQNLVKISSLEFAAKYQSKTEVRITHLIYSSFIFIGLSILVSRCQGIFEHLRHDDGLAPQRSLLTTKKNHQMRWRQVHQLPTFQGPEDWGIAYLGTTAQQLRSNAGAAKGTAGNWKTSEVIHCERHIHHRRDTIPRVVWIQNWNAKLIEDWRKWFGHRDGPRDRKNLQSKHQRQRKYITECSI